jgi:hypothetical protein
LGFMRRPIVSAIHEARLIRPNANARYVIFSDGASPIPPLGRICLPKSAHG